MLFRLYDSEIFAKLKNVFFEKFLLQKLVSRFSQNMIFTKYLQRCSPPVQYEAKYFFLFESLSQGLAYLVALFSKKAFYYHIRAHLSGKSTIFSGFLELSNFSSVFFAKKD